MKFFFWSEVVTGVVVGVSAVWALRKWRGNGILASSGLFSIALIAHHALQRSVRGADEVPLWVSVFTILSFISLTAGVALLLNRKEFALWMKYALISMAGPLCYGISVYGGWFAWGFVSFLINLLTP